MKQAPLVDEIILVEKWQSHSGPKDFLSYLSNELSPPHIGFGFGTSYSLSY